MATATTKAKALDRIKMRIRKGDTVPVSYTHLTLPTNREV